MEKEIENRFKKIEKRVDFIEASISTSLSKPGKPVRCIHCDHLWKTQSNAKTVSCPNCGNKTPTKEEDIKKAEEKQEKHVDQYIKKIEKKNKKYPTVFKT